MGRSNRRELAGPRTRNRTTPDHAEAQGHAGTAVTPAGRKSIPPARPATGRAEPSPSTATADHGSSERNRRIRRKPFVL